MKLMRVGAAGHERPALRIADGSVIDVSSVVDEYDGAWLAAGGMAALESRLSEGVDGFPVVDTAAERIGAPIARPGNILAIGLNYADHAAEAGMDVPSEPVLFTKAPSSYCGPNDTVLIPRTSVKTDWEVELGVVIGKEASYVADEAAAIDHVAGYCIVNDVSERDFQINRGPTWIKGKSAKTFCPTGPWLVSRDEIADPQALAMKLSVNGDIRQNGNTGTMIFGVAHLVWYLSQFLVLEAGDLIATGTPPGVGMGMKPPTYLAPGDVMELEIDGLGVQRQELAQA
ncbi:MAG: Ureidoglycolate lyase [Alphaproteobacteria bacterium MarineAlpha10_Bin2]|nr:MAG: Ureidoglycolate lyase [Alphaproteobacteria bacterium MarineAlpha10_Bin2]HIM46973.1 FAA hydrolase family protein [Alphaproteobacteria bacterium]